MGTIEREPEVIDSLDSTSTIDALSANQGKVLNDKDAIVDYNGANGLLIKRAGKVATIANFPTLSTDSNGNVCTITDSAFCPVTDIYFYTQVYNGTDYINCWFRLETTGAMKILTASGGAVAGLQAQYLKIKGLAYVCNG